MKRTASLRRQHDAALAIVQQIVTMTEAMDAAPRRDQAYDITILLAKLTGLLRIHFTQEDHMLYPSLMASGAEHVANTAQQFFNEMGQIGPVFTAFSEKWCSTSAVLTDFEDFRAESTGLWAALADRIHRENEELYPLADATFGDDYGISNAA